MFVQYILGPEYERLPGNNELLVPLYLVLFALGWIVALAAWNRLETALLPRSRRRDRTLTATAFTGAIFKGWTGACSGTATCVLAGDGSASASFSASSHRRTLTLRVRAQRATGALRVVDGYVQCRALVPVIVERRTKQGWSITRRARTDRAGLFTVLIPKGRATYRVRAPETTANGERCVKTVSRPAATSG